jgi:hypothetical protein
MRGSSSPGGSAPASARIGPPRGLPPQRPTATPGHREWGEQPEEALRRACPNLLSRGEPDSARIAPESPAHAEAPSQREVRPGNLGSRRRALHAGVATAADEQAGPADPRPCKELRCHDVEPAHGRRRLGRRNGVDRPRRCRQPAGRGLPPGADAAGNVCDFPFRRYEVPHRGAPHPAMDPDVDPDMEWGWGMLRRRAELGTL